MTETHVECHNYPNWIQKYFSFMTAFVAFCVTTLNVIESDPCTWLIGFD